MTEQATMSRLEQAWEHVAADGDVRINQRLEANVGYFATKEYDVITRRLRQLEREWDMERILETHTSTLALTGFILGIIKHRGWLVLPAIMLFLSIQHAARGWCLRTLLLRRFGVRTRQEIELEKYALKALRGDFEPLGQADFLSRAQWALNAASAK